nr:immunoglobulin light chain junction region [Mus musculus]
CQQNNEDPPTF